MLALFYSLYSAMFLGTWTNYSLTNITINTYSAIGKMITVLTNMFNGTTTPLTDIAFNINEIIHLTSLILALITSIGIVVVATKGIKKLFTVFFYGVR